MRLFAYVGIAAMSLALMAPAHSANVSLAPTQDYTIANVDDWDHPFEIIPGGPFAGDGNSATWKIFNRFVLPGYSAGTAVTHADYVLHALSDPDTIGASPYPLSLYVISNAWKIGEMDQSNQPRPNQLTPVTSFFVGANQDTHLDLTAAVNAAYHGDGVITLLVANADYHYNSQDFGGNKALNLTISAVPEPETYGMLLAGLSMMGLIFRRRKDHA